MKNIRVKDISHTPARSLFQALDQWGRSKKRARDERGLVKKIGGRKIPDPARRPAAFDKPH